MSPKEFYSPTFKEKFLILILSFLSLWPLFFNHRYIKKLFWFGDELDLISQFERWGFFDWLWIPFAENFVPFWKLVWGSMIFLFDGRYIGMIWVVWITHALTTFLFGLLLYRIRVPRFGVYLAVIVFGSAWTNIESLGWSVQSSAIWSLSFLLLGLFAATYLNKTDLSARNRSLLTWAVFLFVTLSALSFSRGVLSGPVVAAYLLLLAIFQGNLLKEFKLAALVMIPSVIIGLIIALIAGGNHDRLVDMNSEVFSHMVKYGATYLFLNPAWQFFGYESYEQAPMLFGMISVIKGAFIVVSLFIALKIQKNQILFSVLVAFFLLDLGNAVMLGLGRYHEGLPAATGWRYQYVSLVATLPFVAVAFGFLIEKVSLNFTSAHSESTHFQPKRSPLAYLFIILLLGITFWGVTNQWGPRLKEWSKWRGSDGRRALLREDPRFRSWIGIPPNLSYERAHEIVKTYQLR